LAVVGVLNGASGNFQFKQSTGMPTFMPVFGGKYDPGNARFSGLAGGSPDALALLCLMKTAFFDDASARRSGGNSGLFPRRPFFISLYK